ncbi:hypothetical protein HDR63_02930 [bacterium]|nr:hypothetical protein [bacterium]
MKKIVVMTGLFLMMAPAHAGFLDMLGLGQKKEPATFEEACNTDDITAICPEIILGKMTMAECLKSNISKLTTQCATFVKKSASEKINAATAGLAGVKESVATAADAQKTTASAKVTQKTTAVPEKVSTTAEKLNAAGDQIKAAAGTIKSLF